MNNRMRILAVACLLVQVLCFGMDVPKKVKFEVLKYGGGRKNALPCGVVTDAIAPHADIPTQQNISATCREARSKIKTPKLEDLEVLRRSAPFINPIDLRFYQLENETVKAFNSEWQHNFNYTRRVFELADIDEKDPSLAKTVFLERFVTKDHWGLYHQYIIGLVMPAIAREYKEFAVALIKANPHGFARLYDPAAPKMVMFPRGEVPLHIRGLNSVDTASYIELCKRQPSKSSALFRPSEKDYCTIL